MATVILIGGGPPEVSRGKSRGEQDYRESDPGSDQMVDQLMRREDEFAEEAARRHDRGLRAPLGLRPISRRMSR